MEQGKGIHKCTLTANRVNVGGMAKLISLT